VFEAFAFFVLYTNIPPVLNYYTILEGSLAKILTTIGEVHGQTKTQKEDRQQETTDPLENQA
jgi:hypothetical protein